MHEHKETWALRHILVLRLVSGYTDTTFCLTLRSPLPVQAVFYEDISSLDVSGLDQINLTVPWLQ